MRHHHQNLLHSVLRFNYLTIIAPERVNIATPRAPEFTRLESDWEHKIKPKPVPNRAVAKSLHGEHTTDKKSGRR
jgi:hypothetical protein